VSVPLLAETDFSAAEVGKRAGFSSAPVFQSALHAHSGLTPLEYRRKNASTVVRAGFAKNTI
jgi:AraC-like DNA-binding protein